MGETPHLGRIVRTLHLDIDGVYQTLTRGKDQFGAAAHAYTTGTLREWAERHRTKSVLTLLVKLAPSELTQDEILPSDMTVDQLRLAAHEQLQTRLSQINQSDLPSKISDLYPQFGNIIESLYGIADGEQKSAKELGLTSGTVREIEGVIFG